MTTRQFKRKKQKDEEKSTKKKLKQWYYVKSDTNLSFTTFCVNAPYFESKEAFEEAKKTNPSLEYFYWNWSLHQAYKNGEVVPYYKWLQRLEQFSEWEAKKDTTPRYKYNSFLQTFYSNDSTLVPFILIPIKVFLLSVIQI